MNIRTYVGQMYARFPVPLSGRELAAAQGGPRVLANSMPKAGTNLLVRVLSHMPFLAPRWNLHTNDQMNDYLDRIGRIRRGQFLSAHLSWTATLDALLTQRQVRALLIIRDLRDVVVSTVPYITIIQPRHRLSTYLRALPNQEARLNAIIDGIDGELLPDGVRSRSIGEHAMDYLPWMQSPNCLTIRFEDLIGSDGGGSNTSQRETVRTMVQHMRMQLNDKKIEAIAANAFYQGARTFRKGQIGDWRNYFTETHKRRFKESLAGEALIAMGYERTNDW